MTLEFDIKLTKKQEEAYMLLGNTKLRCLVIRWSRQCGKTVFAEIMLIRYLCKKNRFNAYISPSYSQGRKVFKEITQVLNGTGIITKANASTLTIETRLGSTLQMFTMENPNAIRGYTVTGLLVLDEAAFFPDVLPDGSEPWSSVIMPITKAKKPKMLVISTPKGKRGMFYDMFLKANQKEYYDWKALTATIYDDELVSKEDIEIIKKTVSEQAFKEEFLVEFLDSSLTMFKGYEDCFVDGFEYDDDLIQWMGVDLSGGGEDNTIVTLINQKNQVKQILVEGSLDMKYEMIASIIDSTKNLNCCYIEKNGVGEAMINEIIKKKKSSVKVVEWQTTNSSKESIVSALAVRIANKDIVFNKEDKDLFAELGAFTVSYSKTGKLLFKGCHGMHDDRCMSLAIAVRAKDENERKINREYFNIIQI